jgi:hypothetical protein
MRLTVGGWKTGCGVDELLWNYARSVNITVGGLNNVLA